MLGRPCRSDEVEVSMLLQQRDHLALPRMTQMTSDYGEFRESQQDFIERHRLLRHSRPKRPRDPDIDLDWNAKLDTFGIDRKIARMIRREADQRRHDPA